MRKNNIFIRVLLIIGVLLLAGISKVIADRAGMPLILVFLSFYILNRLIKNKNKFIKKAIVVQTGHWLWFVVSWLLAYFLYNINIGYILFDIVALTISIVWLYFAPGIVSVIYLFLFQSLSIYGNLTTLISVINSNSETFAIEAIIAHISFRIAAIVFSIIGYKQIIKDKKLRTKDISNPEETNDLKQRLKKLEDLKAEGLITDEEYISKRGQIIDSM
jgi:hypothetical protein